jgi:transglutaminase-like putative cysteine protease
MRAELIHRLTYRYEAPVQLGGHRLCLRPRAQGHQRLIQHSLQISPVPVHSHELLAASGDAIERVRFQGSTASLQIEARSLVETRQAASLLDCFNGLEPPLPYPRGQLNHDLLGALEGWLPNGQHDPSAVELAQDALMGGNQQALPFLHQLMEMIQDRVKYTQRHVGPAWPAGRTLRERVGSCRDLAMLMMECCRSVGLPARFVSGYHLAEPTPEQYDLHAWTEIYLPGAGWRGFDPSAGGEITSRYIVLASSSKPDLTAAVQGTFSGPVASASELNWTIEAVVEPEPLSAPVAPLIQAA